MSTAKGVSTKHLPPASGLLPKPAAEALRKAVAHRFHKTGAWRDDTAAIRETAQPLNAVIEQVRFDYPEHFQ